MTEYRAPITLDCSGKEAFTAVHQGWRVRDPYLNKVAVWTYYKGAKRDPGIDEGATTVAYVPEKGWFWYIPQHNDMVSVGVVAEGKYLTRGGVKVARADVQTRGRAEPLDQGSPPWASRSAVISSPANSHFTRVTADARVCCSWATRSPFSIRSSAAA